MAFNSSILIESCEELRRSFGYVGCDIQGGGGAALTITLRLDQNNETAPTYILPLKQILSGYLRAYISIEGRGSSLVITALRTSVNSRTQRDLSVGAIETCGVVPISINLLDDALEYTLVLGRSKPYIIDVSNINKKGEISTGWDVKGLLFIMCVCCLIFFIFLLYTTGRNYYGVKDSFKNIWPMKDVDFDALLKS